MSGSLLHFELIPAFHMYMYAVLCTYERTSLYFMYLYIDLSTSTLHLYKKYLSISTSTLKGVFKCT